MEPINTPKLDSHYYLFIGDILFHNVTQFWCCFMSDDREVSVVSFSSSLVFFGNSVQKMCTSAPTYNNENTDSRSTSIAQIYLDFF